MKILLFISTFTWFNLNFCVGQNEYVGYSKLKNSLKSQTIIDTKTGTKFTLDSTQIFVDAFDKKGKLIWRTDPWKDKKLKEYRVKRPIIIQFKFANNKWTFHKKAIWIVYNNTQFGTINLLSGKFTWLGQD